MSYAISKIHGSAALSRLGASFFSEMKVDNLLRKTFRGLQGLIAVLKHVAAHSGRASGPEVLVDIRERVNVRTWMQVVLLFELSGYRPRIRLGSLRQLRSVASLLQYTDSFTLTWRLGKASTASAILCTDRPRDDGGNEHGKTVQLCYDYGPTVQAKPSHFMMPFILHPTQYSRHRALDRLEAYREARRRVRIIFSGNHDPRTYNDPLLRERFGKLPRYPIIHFLKSQGLARVVTSWSELQAIYAGEYYNGLVVVDTSQFRISEGEWLNVLSQADCCLCPPGFTMPMCHNAIEAMAVGTIPVTNYPDWFFPRLTDRSNCIQFFSTEELRKRMGEVQAMPGDEIVGMREQVVNYYDRYLSLRGFGRRLLAAEERELTLHVLDGSKVASPKSRH